MSRKLGAALLLASAALPARAWAQLGDYPLWLERSYFTLPPVHAAILEHPAWYSTQDRPADDDLMFEARIAPQFYLFNTLYEDFFTADDAQWAFGLAFTPGFVVRQLGGLSSPLRSPSFMPKFALQAHWRTANSGINEPFHLFTLQVEHGHHSNGGEPCSFEEEVTVTDSDGSSTCVLTQNVPAADLTVDVDGSFSTNYFRFGGFWSRFALESQGVDWNVGLGVQFELHPEGLKFFGVVGGGLSPEMYEIYGPKRLKIRGQYTNRFGGSRLGLDVEYMHLFSASRPSPDAASGAVTAELTLTSEHGFDLWRFEGLFSGWGIYARFYQGQDYYNQMFFRDIRRLHVGLLVIDQFDWTLGSS